MCLFLLWDKVLLYCLGRPQNSAWQMLGLLWAHEINYRRKLTGTLESSCRAQEYQAIHGAATCWIHKLKAILGKWDLKSFRRSKLGMFKSKNLWGQQVHWVRVISTKPAKWTHGGRREQAVLCLPHVRHSIYIPTHLNKRHVILKPAIKIWACLQSQHWDRRLQLEVYGQPWQERWLSSALSLIPITIHKQLYFKGKVLSI